MLKTSLKQRIIIALIAAILLGSSIAVYVAIIVGGKKDTGAAKLDAIVSEYYAKQAEINDLLSKTYLDEFAKYKSEVKGFNAESANALTKPQVRDIKVGDGVEITEDAYYYTYYIGYCSDEKIFQSSFDDYDNPTKLNSPFEPASTQAIEGWTLGVDGIKTGGVREITIPSQLAYKDEDQACGPNQPIRFIVMALDLSDEAAAKFDEREKINERYMEAYVEYYYSHQAESSATSESSETKTEAEEE